MSSTAQLDIFFGEDEDGKNIKMNNMFLTCFHEFRTYRNPQNCSRNFSIEIKNVAETVYFHKKDNLHLLKEKTKHLKKQTIT